MIFTAPILFYLLIFFSKFQECSFSQLQCGPFESWRFWSKQARQGSKLTWRVQNDWRDRKLWVSLAKYKWIESDLLLTFFLPFFLTNKRSVHGSWSFQAPEIRQESWCVLFCDDTIWGNCGPVQYKNYRRYSKQFVMHFILLCRCLKGSHLFQILSLMKQPSLWQKDTGQHFVPKDLISLASKSKSNLRCS